ncbi:hypothetical protein IL38_11290 [Actinopolyspora erythraea]|uniref:Protein-L-isoaspartate O-methyltransferase n=1 Tax=Actinopolyspora erythraea TaxID=414996 RepID=A0ABR4X4A6_9ACTN|nr:methyltransferase domain-containing protein [Actinopolyspora erythraea]KGI81512.1 hypothetical protein IL38_11290 [Actinopolyspora erythraea]
MTPTTTPDGETLRQRLTERLRTTGRLTTPRWEAAFRVIPRERFVDRFTAAGSDGLTEHDLAADPERALEAIYSDSTLITAWDERGIATSSSTSPGLMALMLEQLDAEPGDRVLEIGTGTGYNAALLCSVLGERAVTSVDVDHDTVGKARSALRECGYAPRVVCGDGARGVPERMPYHRIIATCGVGRIPPEWARQLVPGGILLANLSFALVRLRRTPDGRLSGPFTDTAAFMSMRTGRETTGTTASEILAITGGEAESTHIDRGLPELAEGDVTFLRHLVLPGMHRVTVETERGSEWRAHDTTDGSWIRLVPGDGDTLTVEQSGPRELWPVLTELVETWCEHGKPPPNRYGLTVAPDGSHTVWLDTPQRPVLTLE